MVLCTFVPATSSERDVLGLQFDGPIPPWALADLRACPPRAMAVSALGDDALAGWQALALRNLKAEQRCLVALRHSQRHRARIHWSLRQCMAARITWRVLDAERARRARAFKAQVRTVMALNKVLGVWTRSET